MPVKYRDLRKKLKKYGIVEIKSRGKGSERLFLQESTGEFYPMKCHGEGMDIPDGTFRACLRRFGLDSKQL